MKTTMLFFISLLLFYSLHGQSNEWRFSSPELLNEKINSPFEEVMPILSADGQTLYFVRSFHPENTGGEKAGQDIWYAEKETAGSWTDSKNDLLKFNNTDHNAIIGYGKSGIYLLTAYHAAYQRSVSISYARYGNDDWHIPQRLLLKGIEPKGRFLGFYMHPSEKILLVSMEGKKSNGKEDLYVIILNNRGKWSEPVHLGNMINTSKSDFSPFLTKDTKTLYFSSNGFPDSQSADIYYTKRLDKSWKNWSEPKKVENINSEAFDAYFYLSENTGEAYFASNRQQEYSDIFKSKLLDQDDNAEKEVLVKNTNDDQNELENSNGLLEDRKLSNDLVFSKKGTAYVYFDFASDQLSNQMKNLLDYLADQLSQQELLNLQLYGYADDLGSKRYNEKLSRRRALSVKKYLCDKGINQSLISIIPMGEVPLENHQVNEEFRKLNRRVELVIEN